MIEIDFEKIDWNKLSLDEFQKINEKLISDRKLVKSSERVESKVTGTEVVKLRGKLYSVKSSDYLRLKKMKSEKSREKLINKLISESNPVETL